MSDELLTDSETRALRTSHFQPASGTGGKMPWRLVYVEDPACQRNHKEITNASGNIVRYKSFKAAAVEAVRLSKAGATVTKRNSFGYAVLEPTR